MTASKETPRDERDTLVMLDDLIRRYYGGLLQTIDENPKIGDFIKMVELRRKLTPAGADQARFWKALEAIRLRRLGGENAKAADKPTASQGGKTEERP